MCNEIWTYVLLNDALFVLKQYILMYIYPCVQLSLASYDCRDKGEMAKKKNTLSFTI